MKIKCLKFILGSILLSQSLFAYSLECHGSNASIYYKQFRSDGGAAMRPSEDLVINSTLLITKSSDGRIAAPPSLRNCL